MELIFAELFSTVIKLFALLTPPAVLSAFLGGTQNYGSRRKRRTALRTGAAVFIIGSVLYFFGDSIFSTFGFTLDAFRIGSGILLFTAVAIMSPPAEAHTPNMPTKTSASCPLPCPSASARRASVR